MQVVELILNQVLYPLEVVLIKQVMEVLLLLEGKVLLVQMVLVLLIQQQLEEMEYLYLQVQELKREET
jgi:hypothetical protein